MEIVLGIILIVVVVFLIGEMANRRPVESWSDEKLQRMHPKLMSAGKYEKADDVVKEIKSRDDAKNIATHAIDPVTPVMSDENLSDIHDISTKVAELTLKIMAENKCNEEEARIIIGKEMELLESKYRAEGLSEEEANIRTFQDLGLLENQN